MLATIETKHARFLRLTRRRLKNAKDKLRLVSQLSQQTYKYKPEEAKEILLTLDEDVHHIAEVFDVEYATRIGKSSTKTSNGAQPIHFSKKVTIMGEIEIVRVHEHLRAGRIEEASSILRSAVIGTGNVA